MSTETQEAERPLTQAELEEYRRNMEKHFEEQVPFLKKQAEYEELLTNIEMLRLKRMECIIRQVQLEQGPKKEEPKENSERKLKSN
jgi:uncharacterized membrane-anchored protein YhcB (DUF1043 family)